MGRVALGVLAIILVIMLAGPFLIPVPLLEGTVPPEQLADPDSLFVEINGITVHYKTIGQGEQYFILLHGFVASLFSWHEVMEPLGHHGTVIAYDRVTFGLTERPMAWEGQNPYSPEAATNLLLGLMDHFDIQKAILVGNSAGGTVSMQFALEHPERIQALILVDPAVYIGGGNPSGVRWLARTPQMQHLGPLIVRSIQSRVADLVALAWHDPAKIMPETLEGYKKPLRAENWDTALWNFTSANHAANLTGRLGELTTPVLVITGDDDRIIPTKQSIRLAGELPNATLAVISNAGHVPHEETPAAFMQAVEGFLTSCILKNLTNFHV